MVAAEDALARYALEPVAKLDSEREAQAERIEHAEAHLRESTAVGPDDGVGYHAGIVGQVQGRIANADGIREMNAALRDVLTSVSLGYDGQTLTAEVRVRPSGFEDYDRAVAEIFGTLPTQKDVNEIPGQREDAQLPGGSHRTR